MPGTAVIHTVAFDAAKGAAAFAPAVRKVMEGLSLLEREVEELETAAERIGAAAADASAAVDGLADDAGALADTVRELEALRREAEAGIGRARELADRTAAARDTLAQLEEAGVLDAVEDDAALEEIEERADAAGSALAALLDVIDAAIDEAGEMRAAASYGGYDDED
jgi:hypothetical protein